MSDRLKEGVEEFSKKTLQVLFDTEEGKSLMRRVMFTVDNPYGGTGSQGELPVTVRNTIEAAGALKKVYSLYEKGQNSKVSSELATQALKQIAKAVELNPKLEIEFTRTIKDPGFTASAPVGGGRAGLKTASIKDPLGNISGFYRDDKNEVNAGYGSDENAYVSFNRTLAQGSAGSVSATIRGSKRPGDKPEVYGGIQGKLKFAKGGHVKQYSNAPRKPKLK